MKAIIMAGGKGTRLRPICGAQPKPMTKLMGVPLLEHIIELLRQNGFTELCMTLAYKPECIIDYFGDGKDSGVSIEYRVESEPLGTAGGVRACADFVGNEDFLVISGDAACDFELSHLAREHEIHGGLVTMALYSHSEPLRYGTVITDNGGTVISFIEKPCWERVVTDLVNTGIYMLSPRVLELIGGEGAVDFAKDLFPQLTSRGDIIGIPMSGYWCDIGDGKSYHRCCMDALEGRLSLPLARKKQSLPRVLGQYDSPLRISDSLICEGVLLGRDCVIERSIVHPGSRISDNCHIKDSVIDGGSLARGCIVNSSVICADAALPPDTRTVPGDIISESAVLSAQSEAARQDAPRHHKGGLCRELNCRDRAGLMRRLSAALWEAGADFSDGITLADGRCKVRISPVADDSAITVEAIGGREKERLAICDKYSELAKKYGAAEAFVDIQ